MPQHFYRSRKLPHWQPPESTFFVTARLHGSIPKVVIEKFKTDYRQALLQIEQLSLPASDIADLLPEEARVLLERIRRKKAYDAGKQYFGRFDNYLDKNLNEPHWLRHAAIARLNADNFHFYASKYFDLWAFTIMSNHVHLLLTLRSGAPILWKILRDMKKYSGLHSNRLLGRTGHFWEEESYDHLLRAGEFGRVADYILHNPVKAGIVSKWQDYPWNYCHPALL